MGVVNMKIDERIINSYIVELNNIYTSEIKRVENEFKQTKNKSLLEVRKHLKIELEGITKLYKNINNLHPELGISPFLCLANQNLFPSGGAFRESNALVTNSNVKCTDPKKISKELKDLDSIFADILILGKYIGENNDYTKVDDYIRQVLTLKAKVVNIHPFIDGNGRCSRVLTDYLFMIANINVRPVNKFNDDRIDYVNAMANAINSDYVDLINYYSNHISYEKGKTYEK